MKNRTKAAVVATVLTVDAAVHLYWATGAIWPATTPEALSRAVLNLEARWSPPVLLPIAGMLVTGSALLLARAGGRGGRVAALGSLAVGTGLSLRGAAGLVWITGWGADVHTPFYWLNLLAYTPACLVLAPLALSVAAGDRTGATTASLSGRRRLGLWGRSHGREA